MLIFLILFLSCHQLSHHGVVGYHIRLTSVGTREVSSSILDGDNFASTTAPSHQILLRGV